ncbi:MAG: type IV pili methyl-accepting chemotaxis transducer N-terminal domain-containing protein [Burkholderiales bacterium]|nr:type IV pili methyl-accepting chemotaxis transducer N-terminal domain-containing protein [Burkholderiales bacterium]
MNASNTSLRHSLLIRIAGAMTIVTLVVLAGMGGAAFIAETTLGYAAAINHAGSLRMQSYRLSTLAYAAQTQPENERYRREIDSAIAAFEQSLNSTVLTNPAIIAADSKSAASRQAVVLRWNQQLKPMLRVLLERQGAPNDLSALLEQTNTFVADINLLVKQIEHDTDSRIRFLRTTIGVTLLITLLVVLLTMYFLHAAVLVPLRDLVAFTTQIRRGNLDARTPHIGEDELGRLGHAFNLMAEDLAALYRTLETRVEEKTADLERSNRSLELLYHSIARLYNGPVEADTYRLLLREIEEVLGLGAGSACLMEGGAQGSISVLASTLNAAQGDVAFCSLSSCAECMAEDGLHVRELGDRKVLSIPLRDAERAHGVMQLIIPPGREVEPWKMRLLEALSRHIGTAIGTARRTEHERMLSLLEERSVIARELHDSLAQSLSYMKIQVSRLAGVITRESPSEAANNILGELREGLNGAYRQLRELLTTFRLRIEGENLSVVLDSTVQEFASRNQITIALETHLTNCPLSANEEIHILQIVREALSNVVHHAEAHHAKVVLCAEADGMVSVSIEDDGVGINNQLTQTHHYGMAIMEERARGLGGRLEVMSRPEGGTRIEVRFVPHSRSGAELYRHLA